MPNTREKLIELLCKVQDYGTKNTCEEWSVTIECKDNDEIADYLIVNGVTINRGTDDTSVADNLSPTDKDNNVPSKWIPVTERLPEEDADVLCCRGNHIGALIDVYTYQGDGKWEDSYGYWNYTDIEGITHWMPLPEPPKEVDNG